MRFFDRDKGTIPVEKTVAELTSKTEHRMGMLKVGMERPCMRQPVVPGSDLASIILAGVFSQDLEFYNR